MTTLIIPGKPLGKQRHQTAIRRMKDGRVFTHEYTPEQTVNYETFVKLLFSEAYPDFRPHGKGACLFVIFKMFVPHSKESLKNGWIFAPLKPDEDNTKKIVYDALNHIAWADDCQIVAGPYYKVYSERPRVEISIFEIPRNWESAALIQLEHHISIFETFFKNVDKEEMEFDV